MAIAKEDYSLLLSPGLKQKWYQLTGHMADIFYDIASASYKVYFSQGFHVCLTQDFIEDRNSNFLINLLEQLSNAHLTPKDTIFEVKYTDISFEKTYHLALHWHKTTADTYKQGISFKQAFKEVLEEAKLNAYAQDHSIGLELAQGVDQATAKQMKSHMYKVLYGMNPGYSIQSEAVPYVDPIQPFADNRVRVYDLGDGMLVPVDLCEAIVKLILYSEKESFISQTGLGQTAPPKTTKKDFFGLFK